MFAIGYFIFTSCFILNVLAVPPSACRAAFRWDDCGKPPKAVMYYWKFGSRCEIGIWKGCLPNPNMFANEYECINTCVFVDKPTDRTETKNLESLSTTSLDDTTNEIADSTTNATDDSTTNATGPDGAANGTGSDGAVNGTGSDGASANGTVPDEASANGTGPDEVPANGTVPDGAVNGTGPAAEANNNTAKETNGKTPDIQSDENGKKD